MRSMTLRYLPLALAFGCSGLGFAQAPRAYWSFDQDYSSHVGGAGLTGAPQGGVNIDNSSARIGAAALRFDDGLGQTQYGALVVDTAQSNFNFSGTSSLGPIVGNPANFQLSGQIAMEVDRAQGPIGEAAFTGGDLFTVPGTISAFVRNPITWLPPLATIQIQGARFGIQSASFAVQPSGAFAASVVLTPTAGTVLLTPLVGTPTTIQLASAGPSTPTSMSGTLAINGGLIQLSAPLNVTFMVDDGTGNSATITLVGSALASQALQVAPPSYLEVASALVNPGQTSLSVSAWARYSDLDGLGSDASNSICAARSCFRFSVDNNRSQTRVNAQDTSATTRSAIDATPVDGQWHHHAFVYDAAASRLRLYRDGILRADQPTGGLGLQAQSGFRIGQDHGSLTTNFDGWIDDLAVFDVALSGEAIAAIAAERVSVLALPFGRTCGGLEIGSSGVPELGASFSIELDAAPTSSLAILLLGVSRTQWSGLSLPLDLAILNAPGCDLAVSIDASAATGTSASGTASVGFALPSDPTLVGANLFGQWTVAAPGLNPLGFAWSEGLAIHVVG